MPDAKYSGLNFMEIDLTIKILMLIALPIVWWGCIKAIQKIWED
jgi:hypothetical protein